jgi:hypothetical protein
MVTRSYLLIIMHYRVEYLNLGENIKGAALLHDDEAEEFWSIGQILMIN